MTSRFILPYADVGSGIKPSSGAKLFFYISGTSTPKNTYSDSARVTPNANPVIADSNGVFSDIFITGDYKVVLQDKNGSQIWEADPVSSLVTGTKQTNNVLNRPTLQAAIDDDTLTAGLAINLAERTTGNGGGAMWDTVLASTVTTNGDDIVQCVSVPTLALVQRKQWDSRVYSNISQALSGGATGNESRYIIKDFIAGDGLGGTWIYDASLPKTNHNGSQIISVTVPWDGQGGQSYQDFIDGVGETDGGGNGCLVREFKNNRASNLQPIFIEQFLTGLSGRGQLDSEPDNLVTQQALASSSLAGDYSVVVSTVSNFVEGGHITIEHNNGLYWTYFITNISGSTLSILPALKYDATNTQCERTWYNKAHPGKFYQRQLAQRVANSIEYKASVPVKRVMMSQFDTDPNDDIDTLTVVGTSTISYFPADNIGAVDIGSPPRFNIGRTAFVDCVAAGDGAKSFVFQNTGAGTVNLRTVLSTGQSNTELTIQVWDDSGETIPVFKYVIPAGSNLQLPTYYDLPIQLKGSSNTFYVTITASALPTAGAIQIDQLEIYECDYSNNTVFDKDEKKTLVAFGDSWIQGDLGNSLQREPMTYGLQQALPFVKIINEGFGGDTAGALLDRFDVDVTPHNPDYVLINTGTNDAYNPPSGVFFPNAVEAFSIQITDLISKCQAIGAKPILIGVPALAESDLTFTNYELNDRARQYSQYVYKNMARMVAATSVGTCSESNNIPTGAIIEQTVNGGERCTRFADGTQICTRELAIDTSITSGVSIGFLKPFSNIPSCSMSIQTITTGNTNTAMAGAFVRCATGTQWIIYFAAGGSATETFNLSAIGRWY